MGVRTLGFTGNCFGWNIPRLVRGLGKGFLKFSATEREFQKSEQARWAIVLQAQDRNKGLILGGEGDDRLDRLSQNRLKAS